MKISPERELQLHAVEELLAPKEEPQDVEQPQEEEQRVEAPTHVETSRDGSKCTIEVDRLMHDARENVGEPTSQRRYRRSPEQYTSYMDLLSDIIETELASFEEVVE